MFVPHVVLGPHVVAARARKREALAGRRSSKTAAARVAGLAAAGSAGVSALLAGLLHEVHGGAVAAAVTVLLVAAGVGFGAAKAIGREL